MTISWTWTSGGSAAGQCLHDVDVPTLGDDVGLGDGIEELCTGHEHHHVTPHGTALVDDVAANEWVEREVGGEALGDGAAIDVDRRAADVTLQVLRERHPRHADTVDPLAAAMVPSAPTGKIS
jgi:hypothetical protein